jgi:hypothetical protein
MDSGVFIVAIIFFALLGAVKVFADNRIRSKLIDKGLVDENVKYLYGGHMDANVPSAMKWGLVLIGVGTAFLIGQLVPYEMEMEVTIGAMFVLAGLGLMIYYFLAKSMMKKDRDK